MSNDFVTIKMCYVYNQWYDISHATLYIPQQASLLLQSEDEITLFLRNIGDLLPHQTTHHIPGDHSLNTALTVSNHTHRVLSILRARPYVGNA